MKLVQNLVQRVCGMVLTAVVPRSIKRGMLLISIYHEMVGQRELPIEELQKIDDQLRLTITRDAKSLVLLDRFTRNLWNGTNCQSVVQAKDGIKEIVKMTPCWLMYARRDDIVRDLNSVVEMAATAS